MAEDKFGIDTDEIIANATPQEPASESVPPQVSQSLKSMSPDEKSSPLKVPKNIEAPGFFANAAHSFAETSDVMNIGKGIFREFDHLQEETPPDWSPVHDKFDLYKTVDQKYWGRLASATGPEDQQKILDAVREDEHDDEFYNNGSFSSALFGGIAGGLLSPTTLLAFSSTVKYANLATRIGSTLKDNVPKIAALSLEQETAKQFGNQNLNASQIAFDTMRDTLFGATLIAGGVGLGKGYEGIKMYRNKFSLNAFNEGLTLEPTIKDGVYTGKAKVVPIQGQNVGAAKVDKWQEVYDNSLVLEGAFAVPVLGKLLTKANPVIRGLSHPFGTVRLWTNKIVEHSLNVEGVKKGIPQGANVERLIQDIREKSKLMDIDIKGAWQSSLGIDSRTQGVRAIKTFQQKINSDGFKTLAEFNHEVRGVIINGELSNIKEVNDIAEKVRKHVDATWERFRDAMGLPKDYLSPRTARAYLMKVYDKEAISQNEEEWIKVTADYLLKADEAISTLNAPVDTVKEELKRLKELKLNSRGDQESLKNQIKIQQDNLKMQKNILERKLRDNEEHAIYLDKRNVLTTEDVRDIDNLNLPQVKLNKDLNKVDKQVKLLQKKVSEYKAKHAKTAGVNKTGPVATEKASAVKADLHIAQKELEKAKEAQDKLRGAIEAEKVKISIAANEGSIPRRLYTKNSDGIINLLNVAEDKPVLRKVFNDDNERLAAAKAYGNTITGHTAEQISRSLLAKLVPSIGENPIKARTLMIPDSVHHKAGFLSSNLGGDIATYDLALGRVSSMNEVFEGIHDQKPAEYFSSLLIEEREIKRQAASRKFEGQGLKSEYKKIDDELTSAKSFINNSYNIVMGRTGASLTEQKMTAIARNFTISTLLGAVPLTQVADLGALILKNGPWRFIRDALVPTLKAMSSGFQGEYARGMKLDAAHAHLGMEHLLSGHMDKHFNPDIIGDTSITGKINRGLKKTAEVSGNVFGTTYIDNQLQTLSAHMTQAKIMEFMYSFQKGALRKVDKETMLRNGIDPKEWSKRFIDNFEAKGEKSALGSYNSKWYDWSDINASNQMGDVIGRMLRETILKRGILDNPFFNNSPVKNLALLFKGWVFTATSRYTLPLLQHGEVKDLMSISAGLAFGSLVDPLRKMARGESPDYGGDGQFMAALGHSGALGYIHPVVETANALLNEKFYTSGDKYKMQLAAGLIAGPAGSQGVAFGKAIISLVKNDINEADLKRTVKLIPLSQAWYLRYLSAKFIEGLGLPEKSQN